MNAHTPWAVEGVVGGRVGAHNSRGGGTKKSQ